MSVVTDFRRWVPSWWRGEAGSAGSLLTAATAPVELAFRAGVRSRNASFERGWRKTERLPVPVISIGNLTVGGTGKTPITAWLAAVLAAKGMSPAIAARSRCADEIEVHRELNPAIRVFSAERLIDAAREAAMSGASCVVVDDGFQHRRLQRDLDIVLLAAEQWTDSPKLLPRGPWREPLGALARADVALVTRKIATPDEADRIVSAVGRLKLELPVSSAVLAVDELTSLSGRWPTLSLSELSGKDVFAVASLADPRPFFHVLRAAGANVLEASYPDHYEFSSRDAAAIVKEANARTIVMTRKEAVKLRRHLSEAERAYFLGQTVTIERGHQDLDEALNKVLTT